MVATCFCKRAHPVEAGHLVLGEVAQSHCGSVVVVGVLRILDDDLDLGLGVRRGRSFFIFVRRLRLGKARVHQCFAFRQGLAYAGLFFFEAAYVHGIF